MNAILTFKTNINCDGCVKKVAPALNAAEFIKDWTVDTSVSNKVLTVQVDRDQTSPISSDDVIALVEHAGFTLSVL
jgi:copper chaperone CopZ